MNSSERHIQAMETLAQNERERQMIFGENGGSGPSGFGQGIGNLGGWVMFAGMLGAVLGGLLGRGFVGAIVGAAMLAGPMWALGAFGRASSSAIGRGSVLTWTLIGAMGGAVLGAIIGSAGHAMSAAINWSILGAIVLGGFRLVKRARS